MQHVDIGFKNFPNDYANATALVEARRVVLDSSSNLAYASATQLGLGTLEVGTQGTDQTGTVRLWNHPGTRRMIASAAITAKTRVYAAASGKIASTGTILIGLALNAASADGDVIEVLLDPNLGMEAYAAVAASAAISNTTTETAFDKSYTFPANSLKVGDIIKVRYQLIATSTNSTDTLAVKLYIGGITGTVLISHAATDVADNNVVTGEIELVIRTIGGSGTFVGVGTYKSVPAAEGTMTVKDEIIPSTAIDTTAAQQIAVSATWSVASASNSVRLDILNVIRVPGASV